MILGFPGGPTVPIKVFVREGSRRVREGDGTKQRGLELLQSWLWRWGRGSKPRNPGGL